MKERSTLPEKAGPFFDRILDFFFVLAGILLAFSTLSVAMAIVSRYFFNRPWGWVVEISEYILLYITFLVSARVLKKEGHVKMDIILDHLNPKVRSVVNIITSTICTAACLILTYYGAKVTWDLYRTKAFTYTMYKFPKFIFTMAIFIGSLLLFLQFIRRTYGFFRTWGEP
jgi:C4-dicarboxylate transporter DctQ subunit